MDFLHSRAQRVAAHIRDGLLRKEWTEPLPNSRDWARKLGVSRSTLYGALEVLRKEGLLRIEKRQGIRLVGAVQQRKGSPRLKVARVVYYGLDYSESLLAFLPWIGPLSVLLQRHRIQLSLEKCSDERLRQLCSWKDHRHTQLDELLLPLSLPAKYQKMLIDARRPALLLGEPATGLPMPFINCDNAGAIRHATYHLLRHGASKVLLLLDKGHAPGSQRIRDAFEAACREWPRQPIRSETMPVPLEVEAERTAYARIASRLKPRQGILIAPPLSVGLLMTTLMAHGVAIPKDAEIVAVASHQESIRVHPPIAHYPFPIDTFVKAIANTVAHFFETGSLPMVRKVMPMEMKPAS